ncbi:MAG: methyltransferase domain-containing protein [Candidatus Thiodiazotropha sp. DIVDIV]
MNDQKKEKVQQLRAMWDERYGDQDKIPRPAEVLLSNSHLLPSNGSALDLACGLGGNAMHLAALGLDVVAWDLSPVAIQRLQQLAQEKNLQNLKAEVRDVERHPPSANQFDVIVVSYFLERSLTAALINALKPGGLIYYQTFIRDAVSSEGPKNSNFRLADQELLRLFNKLKIRLYREEGRLGDPTRGSRDVAMLVAEK